MSDDSSVQFVSSSLFPEENDLRTETYLFHKSIPADCWFSDYRLGVAWIFSANRFLIFFKFLPRDAFATRTNSAVYAMAVCLSVRRSLAGIVSKRLNGSRRSSAQRLPSACLTVFYNGSSGIFRNSGTSFGDLVPK